MLKTIFSFSYSNYLIPLAAFFGILIFYGLFKWVRNRRLVQKALRQALEANESDELNLDKRLGTLHFFDLSSHSFVRQELAISELKIAYRQLGAGQDLIMIHGIGASKVIYRRLVPLLAADFRITVIDLPGFGESSKPEELNYGLDQQAQLLRYIIEGLRIKNPVAIGSSMGGAICLKAAIDEPKIFKAIVGLAPATDPKRIPAVILPLSRHGAALHKINSEIIRMGIVRTALRQVVSKKELLTPGVIKLYCEPFKNSANASAAFMKALRLLADRRMPALFQSIQTPVLIIRGEHDKLVRQSSCEDLHRLIQGSTFITHPTAGHHLMEDEPEYCAAQIQDFLLGLH